MFNYQFRISQLKKNLKTKQYRKIAIYGNGVNARRVLKELLQYPICGVIVLAKETDTFCGFPVFEQASLLEIGVDCIIMAAVSKSAQAICQRIGELCINNDISLLNMYGKEEIRIQDILDNQKKWNFEEQKNFMGRQNSIFWAVSLEKGLLSISSEIEKKIWQDIEETLQFPNFSKYRQAVQQKLTLEEYDCLETVYQIFSEFCPIDEVYIKKLIKLESEYRNKYIEIDEHVLHFVRHAMKISQKIVFYSTTKYLWEYVPDEIKENPICEYFVVDKRNTNSTMVESIADEYFSNKIYDQWIIISKERDDFNDYELCNATPLFLCESNMNVNQIENVCQYQQRKINRLENKPTVSILLLGGDDKKQTELCIESIICNTDFVDYEIILSQMDVDSRKNFDQFGEIEIVQDVINKTRVERFNYISKYARGDFFVLLDDTVTVYLNWLYPMVKILFENANIGEVGGIVLDESGKILCAGGFAREKGIVEWYGKGEERNNFHYRYTLSVDCHPLCNILISRRTWQEIDGCKNNGVEMSWCISQTGAEVILQPDSLVECINKRGVEEIVNSTNPSIDMKSSYREKEKKKTVLFISEKIPTYDKDAGSRTIYMYMELLVEKGYAVKMLPACFRVDEPYAHILQQKGIEILVGETIQFHFEEWLCENEGGIDYAFLNYPHCSFRYIDSIQNHGIPTRYYGMDLHYIRLLREYEISHDIQKWQEAKKVFTLEKFLIEHCEVVYYPSTVEVEIVKTRFKIENVKMLMATTYDMQQKVQPYYVSNRSGMMFVGGYGHRPNVDAMIWFITEIYPIIYVKTQAPFYLVGSNMPEELNQLESPGLVKVGYLSDKELDELYGKVRMIVVPLRYGAGIKGKVIEAMYYGVPVITTSIGAEGVPGAEIPMEVVDGSEAFANRTIETYYNEEKLQVMSKRGRIFISKYFSKEAAWESIKNDFGN